jgi:acetyl-CoA carboxylase carboxyl transferase subunit beta
VIKQAVGKDLPKGFQRSEFVLEKGFLDIVVHRKEMKETITNLLRMLAN